jgi:hypothetical protein
MDDIFDQSNEVRPHLDTHKLIVEARAELNAIEKADEQTVAGRRKIGGVFKKIVDWMGHGAKAWIARHMKVSDSYVARHIELFESPDYITHEEAMAIIWGHKPKAKAEAKEKAETTLTDQWRKRMWKSWNHFQTHSKGMAQTVQKEAEYEALAKHFKAIEKVVKGWEKEAGL